MKKENSNIKSENPFKNVILIFFLLLFFAVKVYSQNSENTKSAFGVIERLVGNRAVDFQLSLVESKNHQTDWFEIETTDNLVKIKASNNTAICYAAYNFLRDIGAVLVSWEGNKVNLPKSWPKYSKKGDTPFKYREYLNACTFGYTTPWWDWKRWEQEIDWMALHGINLPTAMEGQEPDSTDLQSVTQLPHESFGVVRD